MDAKPFVKDNSKMEVLSRVVIQNLSASGRKTFFTESTASTSSTLKSLACYAFKTNQPNHYTIPHVPFQTTSVIERKKGPPPAIEHGRGASDKKRRPYTTEEDNLILSRVKSDGDKPETWKTLAKELDRDNPQSIKSRFRLLVIRVWGIKRFTFEEDKLILDYVKKHGISRRTFENLATQLSVFPSSTIKTRLLHIIAFGALYTNHQRKT